jgi:hypothetical protein
VNIAFVKVYPMWSVLMIVLSSVLIYAVVLHGREVTETGSRDMPVGPPIAGPGPVQWM